MAYISATKHKIFLETLKKSISQLEALQLPGYYPRTRIAALKEEMSLLENIYEECDKKTNQLRTLIAQYFELQRKTRVDLRVDHQQYLKNKSTRTSFRNYEI